MKRYHQPFYEFCPSCDAITTFKYLDCEKCREENKGCLYICTKCGTEAPESPEHPLID